MEKPSAAKLRGVVNMHFKPPEAHAWCAMCAFSRSERQLGERVANAGLRTGDGRSVEYCWMVLGVCVCVGNLSHSAPR